MTDSELDRPAPPGGDQIEDGSWALYVASDLLRQRALTDPTRVFLEIGSTRITYRELDARVDRLAQWLLDSVGGSGRRIGLHTAGTEAMAIASLALRRAAMVGVCLDPTAPAAWVGHALADCGAALLLSDTAQASPDIPCPVVHPCAVGADPPQGGVRVVVGPIGSIVYTSGSTGEPKGVVISSTQRLARELSLVVNAAQAEGPESARIAFLGFGSVGFMDAVVHMGIALDATLVGYDIRAEGIQGLGAWLAENRIWSLVAVPTLLRHVLATLPPDLQIPTLGFIFLYGEAITWEDLTTLWRHVGEDSTVLSFYGCSESQGIAMMTVTASTPLDNGRLPAGVIGSGVRVTIEDSAHRPLPDGEVGEIVAWTQNASLGYWNRPEDTARVFGTSDDDGPFVRTGDLGRLRPDGLLEHLGRMDDMVKVSGHRVMLSEVETALARLPNTAASAAVSQPDAQGNIRIIAYVVPEPGSTVEPASLRAALGEQLPAAAVPDRVHLIAELPTLASGKVDRNALRTAPPSEGFLPTPVPDPVRPGDGEATDETMGAILAMWSDILGVDANDDDDFFDSGGDSLRAARLFAEIELELGADLPLSLLVEAPTPRMLAMAITSNSSHDNLVVPIQTMGHRPPLFIVHDLSGSVFFARVIAERLGEDQPVYAIRSDVQLGLVTGAESIQEVAARYLPGVLHTSPDACSLYGSSAGGVIAFELALQLADKGVDVAFLGLGDSFGPGSDRATLNQAFEPQGGIRFRRRLNDLRAVPWARRPWLAATFLGHRVVAEARHRLAPSHEPMLDNAAVLRAVEQSRRDGTPLSRQFRALYGPLHYGPLSVAYLPARKFDGSAALLRTLDEGSETLGWSDYVTGTVRVFRLPAFHYQLHEEATLRRTGELLDQALRQM
jgi:acyl-coenzyme A synthetase/AMP-(fatty) acid ligase/thioesterase domain-containing protein/acyl carrier protein